MASQFRTLALVFASFLILPALDSSGASSGCGVSATTLDGPAIVAVTDSGALPADLVGVTPFIAWSSADYLCVLPEDVGLSAAFPDDDDALHPWQDLLLNGPENLTDLADLLLPPPASTASHSLPGGVGSGPRLGADDSIVVWNHRVPDSFANSAPNGCNWQATNLALAALESETGADFEQVCLHWTPQHSPWEPCRDTVSGAISCTDDSATILSRFTSWAQDAHVTNGTGQSTFLFADDTNEVNLAWVGSMSNNGIAMMDGWVSVAAEEVPRKDDWPHKAIVMHELGHLFFADDFPSNGVSKYKPEACSWPGCASYDSVMNYYWASSGWMEFKHGVGGDWGRVYENVRDVSVADPMIPQSLPLRP